MKFAGKAFASNRLRAYKECMEPYNDLDKTEGMDRTKNVIFIIAILAILTIISDFSLLHKDMQGIFEGTRMMMSMSSQEVFYVMVSTLFAVSSLLFDFAVDVVLFVRSSLYGSKSSRMLFYHELAARMLLLIGVITLPALMASSLNDILKCGLYVIWGSLQNLYLAAAVAIMLLKYSDAIIHPDALCIAFTIYAVGQIIDIFNQISLTTNSELGNGYQSMRIVGIVILGTILLAVLIRSMYAVAVLRLRVSLNDSAGTMLITTLFAGAASTEVMFTMYPSESGTSKSTSQLVVIYNQYMGVVLTLCIHMIIKRLALLELKEKRKMLDRAHFVLKAVYEPLKFIRKYLKVLCSAEDLQDPCKSRLLNYMTLATNMSLQGFSDQRELMHGVVDYLHAQSAVAGLSTLQPLDIEDLESSDGGTRIGGLTNAELESELGVSSLATLEGVHLESLEKDYTVLDRLHSLAGAGRCMSPYGGGYCDATPPLNIETLVTSQMIISSSPPSPTRRAILTLGDDTRLEVGVELTSPLTDCEIAGMKASLDMFAAKYSGEVLTNRAAWGSLFVNTRTNSNVI